MTYASTAHAASRIAELHRTGAAERRAAAVATRSPRRIALVRGLLRAHGPHAERAVGQRSAPALGGSR
jgi:hypothetical protein